MHLLEDLRRLFLSQVGDVAFSVPNSLVVTLERVLGNETIGKVHWFHFSCAVSFLIYIV